MKLAEVCVKRPVFATMLVLVFVVLGLFAYSKLGIDLYPKVDLPTVTVQTRLPGGSPEEIESQVTKPIEEAINTISNIDELRSTTLEGLSLVTVQFSLDKDSDVAAQEVRDKVATVVGQLPRDTEAPIIERLDFDASPVLSISVYGDRPIREITELADKRIKQRLESVDGIGSIQIVGGQTARDPGMARRAKLQALSPEHRPDPQRDSRSEHGSSWRTHRPGPERAGPPHSRKDRGVRDFGQYRRVHGWRKPGLFARRRADRRRCRRSAEPCAAGREAGGFAAGSETVRHQHRRRCETDQRAAGRTASPASTRRSCRHHPRSGAVHRGLRPRHQRTPDRRQPAGRVVCCCSCTVSAAPSLPPWPFRSRSSRRSRPCAPLI